MPQVQWAAAASFAVVGYKGAKLHRLARHTTAAYNRLALLLTLNSLTRPHLSRARRANSSPSNAMSAWNLWGWIPHRHHRLLSEFLALASGQNIQVDSTSFV
jgi:hypothetical protein